MTEEDARKKLVEYDHEVYSRLTDIFTKHGLQYRDAPQAYDLLTRLRSEFEGGSYVPGKACTKGTVNELLDAIELLVEAMNRMRGSGHGQGQG